MPDLLAAVLEVLVDVFSKLIVAFVHIANALADLLNALFNAAADILSNRKKHS